MYQLKEDDKELLSKLEEYARLQVELDRRVGSLSLGQLLMMMIVFVTLIFFLGFVGELFFAALHSESSSLRFSLPWQSLG